MDSKVIADLVTSRHYIKLQEFKDLGELTFSEQILLFPKLTDGAMISVLREHYDAVELSDTTDDERDFVLKVVKPFMARFSKLLSFRQRAKLEEREKER